MFGRNIQQAETPSWQGCITFGGKWEYWIHSKGCLQPFENVRESLIEVGDAEAIMNHFKKRKIENPSFYYAVQVDAVGRAKNIFWLMHVQE